MFCYNASEDSDSGCTFGFSTSKKEPPVDLYDSVYSTRNASVGSSLEFSFDGLKKSEKKSQNKVSKFFKKRRSSSKSYDVEQQHSQVPSGVLFGHSLDKLSNYSSNLPKPIMVSYILTSNTILH